MEELARRSQLGTRDLEALARSGALAGLAGHRRRARWAVAGLGREIGLMRAAPVIEELPFLSQAPEGQEIVADYDSLGFTLRRHPLALLRPRLAKMRLSTAAELKNLPNGRLARTAGIVTVRQRPGTAKGTVFVTVEDETGCTNIIVWPKVVEKQRRALIASMLLTIYGVWQREGQVMHLVAHHLLDHSYLLGELFVDSRNFH